MVGIGLWARFQIGRLSNEERAALRASLTLTHFRDRDRLVAVCSQCYFGKIINPSRLRRRLTRDLRDATFASLERRLKCSQCGAKGKSRFYYAEVED